MTRTSPGNTGLEACAKAHTSLTFHAPIGGLQWGKGQRRLVRERGAEALLRPVNGLKSPGSFGRLKGRALG